MYDTILIGKDFSSLIAALASSSQGGKTLVLSDEDESAVHTGSDCVFNVDPFPWTGFLNRDSFLHGHLMKDLLQVVQPLLVPLDPGLQIILPENRVDVYGNHDRILRESSREFQGMEAKIRSFYEAALQANIFLTHLLVEHPTLRPGTMKKIPSYVKHLSVYLREKLRCDAIFRSIRDDSVRLFFESQLALLSNRYPVNLTDSPMSPHVLLMPLQGFLYPLGGKQAVMDALELHFSRQGGALFKGCNIEKITPRTGAYLIEGRLDQEKIQYSARHLIVSKSWKNMDRFFRADERKGRRFADLLKRSEKHAYPFTLYMGVLDKGLPERIAEYVVMVLDKNKPLQDLNFIFIELSRRGDVGRAPDGKRAMSATVFLNKAPSQYTDSELSDISDNLLRNLNGFLPFLSENIDFLDRAQCMELSRKFEETATHRYRILRRSFLHLSTLSSKTPFENVYLTGKDIFPDLGFEGEILSGLNAANLSAGGFSR